MRLQRETVRRWARLAVLLVASVTISGCTGCVEETDETVDFFKPHEYGEWEYRGEPDIDGPERLLIGDVLEGETVSRDVEVTNVGRNLLKLGEWQIEGRFRLSFPRHDGRPPVELMPGEAVTATITYTAHNTDRAEGVLSVESNDPDEGIFEIPLYANADFPCLELDPADEVDFGMAELGETSRRFIIAKSCARRSPTTFSVTSLDGADEFSLLDNQFRSQVTLEPGAQVRIPIGFSPETPGEYEGAVFIRSDDDLEPNRVVDLQGRGRPYDCPEPVIRAYNPERGEAIADPMGELQVVPLDDIDLDASLSRDPEGSGISRVEWRLAERPADSTEGLANTSGEQSSLWMQLAGTYVVELDVWNELGVKSCEPARMTLKSISDEDIHIQLVWNTPADPNETDQSGSDVDIHLLHPNANLHWNSPPWDCFWQNMEPDWGETGVAIDNPSLDIDDVDGAGPENINLDNPEVETTYNVGAYYFSDHNYGRSYVTVRIYIGGQLAYEAQRKPMDNQEFWHVANIDWPSGEVIEVDRLYQSFP
ncbi:choice-of-anchor D domain-containing protein [Persicimonas caeni]|nr:choice-of-anchor D domain-containing protein [Persicimonas caeni]